MSELEQNKEPQNSNPGGDDELESLSTDEKAAFEKIMAEIAAATGGGNTGSGNGGNAKAKTPEPVKAAAPPKEKANPAPKESPKEVPAPAPTPAPLPTPAAEASDSGQELSNDQQANLDQIMAEIDAKRKSDKVESPKPKAAQEPDEALSNDQQAALDQIMAEIDTKRKGDKAESPNPTASQEPDEALSNDQQAALDQIMAEIETKRKSDKVESPKPKAAQEPDEALSNDQQAALDQIMAEIDTKRKSDKVEVKKPIAKEDNSENDTPDADQQAALDKIMAEIAAKKAKDENREVNSSTPEGSVETLGEDKSAKKNPSPAGTVTEKDAAAKSDKDNLSMEEFDDELTQLLTEAQKPKPPEPADKTKQPDGGESAKTKTDRPENLSDPASNSDSPSDGPEPPSSKHSASENKDFPILQEVTANDDAPAPKEKRKKGSGAVRSKPARKPLFRVLLSLGCAMLLLVISGGGYWAFHHYNLKQLSLPFSTIKFKSHLDAPSPVKVQTVQPNQPSGHPQVVQTVAQPVTQAAITDEPAITVSARKAPVESPAQTYAGLKRDLFAARQQIQTKISDIQQLKSYYSHGIEEESDKIEDSLDTGQIPSFEKAMANKKIELGLRAIQRRQTYITKLETPLAQLSAMAEELLFLERRTQTYDILNTGISGLPVDSFRQEVTKSINSYLEYNTQLSIDRVEATPPTLPSVWEKIVADLNQKTSLLAQRAPLNRAISNEICKGNYERKYLLTALSAETAGCLFKWNGKDLYLSGLTDLTPEVAAILAQWPGEWISLNGLKELSAESAKQLSQWPGKRLSLNGLIALSPEATAYLSKWKGAQLEMVGLQSIGPWKNYGTRLFLSEKLRRQLETQLE